jgi:hypothetical protein
LFLIKLTTSSKLLATQVSLSPFTKKELVPAPLTITSAKSSKFAEAIVISPPLIMRVPIYKEPTLLLASSYIKYKVLLSRVPAAFKAS